MDIIGIITLILGLLYLLYVVIEGFYIRKYRKNIKLIIHVNGIRGKSTVTRLIDSGLREFNYKVISKTTGTVPTIIDINNNEKIIKRIGPANIKEQIKLLRLAYKQKADVLVIECMAVNKDLQYISENSILKANINIITNVREDHIGEMGDNKEELAIALSNTTPKNGYLVISDSEYNEIFSKAAIKNHSKLIIADKYESDSFNTFSDNIGLALEVANILSLDKEKYLNGLSKYKYDVGALAIYKLNDSTFVNGLSINDIDSIKIIYDKIKFKINFDDDLTILINNRDDRPTRINSIINNLNYFKFKKIIVCGSNITYTINKIKKLYPDKEVVRLTKISDLNNEKVIFGIGNIANIGWEIIDYYKKGEKIC